MSENFDEYESMKNQCIEKLSLITRKKHIFFMDKCRDAAELIMHYSKDRGFTNLIIQEEGGWYTYEKSAQKLGMDVLSAPMFKGVLIKDKFPFKDNSLIILNTNPGYAFIEPLSFYDDFKKLNTIIVNDIVSSIGDDISLKGDILIGSFGKNKPLTISSGGAFVACDNLEMHKELLTLKESFYPESGKDVSFNELIFALDNVNNKKKRWSDYSTKIKVLLLQNGFDVMNLNDSINIFVKTSNDERENLINFCVEHNLEYVLCPKYIRTMQEAVSIEIKKKDVEDL
jgi:hypothetical protein